MREALQHPVGDTGLYGSLSAEQVSALGISAVPTAALVGPVFGQGTCPFHLAPRKPQEDGSLRGLALAPLMGASGTLVSALSQPCVSFSLQ